MLWRMLLLSEPQMLAMITLFLPKGPERLAQLFLIFNMNSFKHHVMHPTARSCFCSIRPPRPRPANLNALKDSDQVKSKRQKFVPDLEEVSLGDNGSMGP